MAKNIRKIALINPKIPLKEENRKVYDMYSRNKSTIKPWYVPPLNLLIIAAHTPDDIEVILIDEHFESIDFDAKYDLVGLTAMTQQAIRAYDIADKFRARNIPVVMGGIHATILPDEALKHADTVFIGEGEEIWEQYILDLEIGNAKKKYKRDNLFDLSLAKVPRFDLINFDHLKKDDFHMKYIPIHVTRGCPHSCNFCVVSEFYGKKIRKKPIHQVITELEYLKKYNSDFLIIFADDNFFVDRPYVKSLLKEIIPLKINYFVQSDIKIAEDPELLELAYLSGCQIVFVGFESISVNSLSEINENKWKMKQLQNYGQSIKTLQDNGLVVFGAFIIGFKNDDINTFNAVRDFVLENKIYAQFTLLTPIPGSDFYKELDMENKLIKRKFWDSCSFFNLVFEHDNLKKDEAESALIKLYEDVFSEENAMNRTTHMIKKYKELPPRWVYSEKLN